MSLKNIYFVANWKMHGSINSSHLVKKYVTSAIKM